MNKQFLTWVSCLSLILMLSAVSFAGTYSSDFGQYLTDNQDKEMVSAIITMAEQVDLDALKAELYVRKAERREWHEAIVRALQQKATENQASLIAQLGELQQQGTVEKFEGLWLGNVVLVTATPAALNMLVQRDDILQIDPDYMLESVKPQVDESEEPLISSVEIGLERINADLVWAMGFTGEGRLVSHLDTGVDGNHPALNARWRGYDSRYAGHPEWAWFDPVTNTEFPFDSGQHGTHTMGTICGLGESTGDTIGVAFGAEWVSAGVIDRVSIPQTVQDALLAFQWLADPDQNPSTVWDVPDVCSNSWGVTTGHGYPPCDQTFWTVLDALEAAGVVVVFAAGNEGPSANSLRRPSDRASTDLSTFSVGALDGNNVNLPIADFSSRGPSYCTPDGQPTFKPEVSAPGVNVRSSVPGGSYQGGWSGTSMACPHVAGVVALIRQANPNLTTDQVKQILLDTATDLGSEGEDNDYGMGIVDAYAAVQMALAYLQGWGTLAGIITDQASGDPIFGATVSVLDRPWSATSRSNGWYYLFMPADTVFNIKVEYPPTHLPIYDSQSVTENDTTIVNYALEGKVEATLMASFSNPADIAYRTFYLKGSWDNDGFYDETWSGDYLAIRDDGEAPDNTAGDGVFTGQVLLARDLVNTYSWAIYTEDYGGEDARLDDGADFDIPDLNPPTVPTLVVNPSGSDNNFVFSAEGDNGLSLDLMPGIDSRPWKWGASDSLQEGVTYTFNFQVMHSDQVTYGSGGVGGPDLQYTPEVTGAFDFIFNDMDDSYLVQLTGTEGPPVYLSGQSGLDGHVQVAWLPPGTTESQEIAYDDGALANGYYYYAAANLMATMFIPESYPVSIDSVMVHVLTQGDPYWPWPDGDHDPVGISIFVDDGSGYPDPDPVFYAEATCELGQWIRIDVDEVVVSSGYFWVALNNLSDTGPYDGMGIDAFTDYPANKWAREDGTWSMQDTYTGDHMIRAKVFGGAASEWLGYDDAMPAREIDPAIAVSHNSNLAAGTGKAQVQAPATENPLLPDRMAYYPHILSEPPLITDTEVLAGYNLYRDVTSAPFDRDMMINDELITATNYDDWGNDPYGPIQNGTMYYYQASAVYDIGGGAFVEVGPSNEITATPQNHPPEAPVNLTGDVTDHTVTLTWDPNTDYDIASYNIYRRDYNQSDFNLVGNVAHPTTTFSEDIVIDGIYRYKIKAVDSGDMESENFSNYIDLGVGLIPPGVLSASDDLEFQIELSWRNPGGLALDVEDLDIAVVHSDYSNAESEVVQYLLDSGEITSATFIDAYNGTPTLQDLEPFDLALVWSNYQYYDPIGLGDVLADYVELGKGVVALEFTFTQGWGMSGRFMSEYSPFGATSTGYVGVSLGDYDAGSPLMDGVTSLGDYYVFQVPEQNNAEVVAYWDNGWPAVAFNTDASNVVCINGYIGFPDRQWTGDMMQLVLNSVLFVSGGQGIPPDGFKLYKADNESGPFTEIASLPGDQNDYLDLPVPNAVPYYYQVTAVWGGEESDPSNTAMGIAQNYAPEPAYNLETAVDGRNVNLTWTFDDLMGDLDYFNIYRKLMPYGDWVNVGTSDVSSFVDNVAEGEDGAYGYVVTAVDDGAPPLESENSNTAYALVGTLPPNGLVALSDYEFSVPLRWLLPGSWSSRSDHMDHGPDLPILTSIFNTLNDGSDLDMSYKNVEGPVNLPIITDQGGPDDFGYTWIDSDEPGGPVYAWRDITDMGQQIPITGDDQNMGPNDIGFDFPYYGETFSTFNICGNGWISFTSTDANYYNQPLPDPSMPLNMVAPFWDDLYPPNGGEFWYYSDGSECIISYINVPHIGSGGPYTFQIILRQTGTMIFQYENMGDPLNTCTIGIQNGDGSIGLQVVFDADYVHSNMAIRLGTGPEGVPPVHYNLYRSLSSPVPVDPGHLITSDISGELTAYTDTYNIVNGTMYYYTMTATWPDSAESPGSNEANATPANHPPEAPTALEAVADHYDVNLTWEFTNNMGDLDYFNVYRKLVGEQDWTFVGTSNVTSYLDQITPGEDGVYIYSITAVDDGSPALESNQSNSAYAPVGNLPPMNLIATSNQDAVVPLRWAQPGILPCTTLAYDDGLLANGYYYYDAENIMASHFMAPSPVEICSVFVHVLTEGDPYWPWPDPVHDPVNITVWEGDGSGQPGAMLGEATVTAELGEWITVAFDPPLMSNTDNFWVGMNNLTDVGPYDGIGLDANTDYPEHKWAREYGTWFMQNTYNGDHMIRASIRSSGRTETLSADNPISEQVDQAEVANFSRLTKENNSPPELYDTEVMLGYYIYRDTSPNVPIDDAHRITDTYVTEVTYDDETVTNGTTYYYIVLAVYDNDGNIEFSPPSNEESATPYAAGHMVMDPTEIDTFGTQGEQTIVPLTMTNDGGLMVSFNITPMPDLVISDVPYRGNTAQAKFSQEIGEFDKSSVPQEPQNPPVITDYGGPDAFGYTWIDSDEPNGPQYSWVDISVIGDPLFMSDDDNQGPFGMSFSFPFYGQLFNTFRVCSNGFISFTSTMADFMNQPIPSSSAPENLIAPFWDDLNPLDGGAIYYYTSPESTIVSWEEIPHYGGGGPYFFQIILTPDGSITFQYPYLGEPTNSATIGIQDASQTIGLQIAYEQYYAHDDLAIRINTPWLNVDTHYGDVMPGEDFSVNVILDATSLQTGMHTGDLMIDCWDMNHQLPVVQLPVSFMVNPVGIEDDQVLIPREYSLNQNYPNPFNARTEIRYALPADGHVRLEVYNVLGQKVATLVDERKNAGYHSFIWDGSNSSGETIASGIYLYKLVTKEKTYVKKMVLLK